MHKLVSAVVATTLAGAMALPAPALAQSGSVTLSFGQQDRYIGDYCDDHPRARGCNDWRQNRHHWSRNDYRNWYMWNRSNIGNVGVGLFGLALGLGIANSINNSNDGYNSGGNWSNHVDRCEARFRSYDARSDTYLGYDGMRHRCNL